MPRYVRAAKLIEREHELAVLSGALAAGCEGLPSAVIVVGEPGLGKSHLLRSLRVDDDQLVLRGYSLDADTPPYFPFRRAFARLERAGRLPGSGTAQSTLRSAAILSDKEPGTAAADHLAVSDALTEALVSLSEESPVVLILDDMQWASQAVWGAVTYLVRAAEGARITVLMASRPEGLERPGAGAAAITELNRNRLLQVLSLSPLSTVGISRLVLQETGADPSPSFLSALVARTGGNPFFVEEVLRSLAEAGQLANTSGGLGLAGYDRSIPLPDTLRLAIWERLERLPEVTLEALRAAAVVGRVFGLSLLSRMLGRSPDWIAGALAPAAKARIVAEDTGDRWAFVHDTLRDAVLDQVGETGRSLHRAAAQALGEVPGADSDLDAMGAIARHLRKSGDAAAAVVAALHASALALAGHAAQEALELATEAEASFFGQHARPPHITGADVHRALARASAAAAEYQRAESEWLEVLDDVGEDAERARILVELATVARRAERSDAAAQYFERALALLETGTDARALMEALVELSTLEGTTRSDYGPAVTRAERAMTLAQEAGDAGLQARAALALANARARSETPKSARPLLRVALERALDAKDLFTAAEAASSLSNSHYWTGELRSALAYGEQRLEIAQRGRDAFALRHAHSWLSLLATTAGDWDRARDMARQAEAAIARMGSPEPLGFLRVVEGLLALRTGELDLALRRTGEATRILMPLGDATISWYIAVHIWTLIAAGRITEAVQECRSQEARLATMPANALPARSARCGLGRAYVALGDLSRAAECEKKLTPFIDDFHWRPARLTLAATAALRGDRQRAIELLAEVERFAEASGLEYDLADARRIHRALRDGVPAVVAFARPDAPPAPGKAATLREGLSPREQEVLRLVAEGLTNREIAEQLVLSERTVVNHVSHIFEKIGVDNRAAATAFAFRSGLAGDK